MNEIDIQNLRLIEKYLLAQEMVDEDGVQNIINFSDAILEARKKQKKTN